MALSARSRVDPHKNQLQSPERKRRAGPELDTDPQEMRRLPTDDPVRTAIPNKQLDRASTSTLALRKPLTHPLSSSRRDEPGRSAGNSIARNGTDQKISEEMTKRS